MSQGKPTGPSNGLAKPIPYILATDCVMLPVFPVRLVSRPRQPEGTKGEVMKKISTALFVLLVGATPSLGQYELPHDCTTYCDPLCQQAVEALHQGPGGLPPHCTNGAPGTGPHGNTCFWDFDPTKYSRTFVQQDCNAGGGCTATGKLMCPKPNGSYGYPSYTFNCNDTPSWGGMPVQSVDSSGGVCTWPNGFSVFIGCNEEGTGVLTGAM